jgi:hypothetical protein
MTFGETLHRSSLADLSDQQQIDPYAEAGGELSQWRSLGAASDDHEKLEPQFHCFELITPYQIVYQPMHPQASQLYGQSLALC